MSRVIDSLGSRTALITCSTLDNIASSPNPAAYLGEDVPEDKAEDVARTNAPCLRLFFKCENLQKIGAFKARGAFHAVKRLIGKFNWHFFLQIKYWLVLLDPDHFLGRRST